MSRKQTGESIPSLDINGSDVTLSIVQLLARKVPTDKPLINLAAIFRSATPASLNSVDATWFSNNFSSASRIVNSTVDTSCVRSAADPVSSLSKPVDLTKSVTNLLLRYRTSFPKGACATISNGQYSVSTSSQAVSFTNGGIVLGEKSIDLTPGRYTENVQLLPSALNQPDFDPSVLLTVSYLNGDEAQLSYNKYRGLTQFSYATGTPTKTLSCSR
jgi:hypothetical protein